MSIDNNMKQVLKFNRSSMAKQHYSKSDLEQIAIVYQMCKQSHYEPQKRDVYNSRFAMIVEEASKMIKSFSDGKISVSADALDLMQDFVEEFGREYVRYGKEMRYEPTQDAICAKLMIQKLRHQHETASKPEAKVITHPATEQKRAYELHKKQVKSAGLMSKLISALSFKKRSKKTTYARKSMQPQTAKRKKYNHKSFKFQNTVQLRKKFFIGVKNSTQATMVSLKNDISGKVRRYGMAAIALWGVAGNIGFSNADAHVDKYQKSQVYVRDLSKFEMPDEAAAAIAQMRPAKDTLDLTAAFTNQTNFPDLEDFQSNLDLSLPWLNYENSQAEEEEKPATIADISYADYYFSGDELAAMGESKIGEELTKQAAKVALNMNCEGYCYRGVKRMFNRINLGVMEGRSAYMAKSYMDANQNFKQIRCDFDDLDKLPNGSVVIFDRGRKSHVHGHIFVVGRDKQGKARDFSSKIRNVRRNLNGYGGYYVYVPADTPVPETVQEKIASIMVLNHPTEEAKTTKDNQWMIPMDVFANSGRSAI